jgi:transcription-repair coupling factor (superfamily II helicase)
MQFEASFPMMRRRTSLLHRRHQERHGKAHRDGPLICGDVGYGKTEIAFRAAFKAVMSGKQVAFLALRRFLPSSTTGTSLPGPRIFRCAAP